MPTTTLSAPRRRGNGLILTLLHYISVRKALEIDLIEERSSFAGEKLLLPPHVQRVVDFEMGLALEMEGEYLVLPNKKGQLLLEVPDFFAAV